MTELPEVIDPSEEIGRGVFDSKKAKHARAGKIAPRIFRERDGVRELSVDRLSFGGQVPLSELHDSERPGQLFYGWAQLTAEAAARNDRTVLAKPIMPTNPFHAEIILPEADELEFADEQDQHSLNLAMLAVWQPRP